MQRRSGRCTYEKLKPLATNIATIYRRNQEATIGMQTPHQTHRLAFSYSRSSCAKCRSVVMVRLHGPIPRHRHLLVERTKAVATHISLAPEAWLGWTHGAPKPNPLRCKPSGRTTIVCCRAARRRRRSQQCCRINSLRRPPKWAREYFEEC